MSNNNTAYLEQNGLLLIDNGYSIIPIKPSSKLPGFDGWQNTRSNPEKLNEWLENGHENSGIGILTKYNPAVDIDVSDERVNKLITDHIRLIIGDAPQRVGRNPRRITLFRTNTPFHKMKTGKYKDEWGDDHEVEILGDGQQFVAYGLHKDTGQPYKWVTDSNPINTLSSDLLELTQDQAISIIEFSRSVFEANKFTPVGSSSSKTLSVSNSNHDVFAEDETKINLSDEELGKRLMMVTGAEDHDRWVQIGMALYHQFDGDKNGLAFWHKWSKTADNYDAKALDSRYKSFSIDGKNRSPITARLIIQLSNEVKQKALVWQKPSGIDNDEWQYSKLSQDCIIQDLLYADVGLLIAPGGVGKTTLLLFLMVHVVLGLPFLGRNIERKGKVLYVTAEDSREILIARLRHICSDMKLSQFQIDIVRRDILISDVSGSTFKLTMIVSDVVTTSLQVDEIISHYEKDELAIVAFDPVISFGVGESRVNDAEQGLVNAGRIIRNKINCCILFVHHTGKANAREGTTDQYSGRGGSAFADGSRMTLVMQTLNPIEWKKQTGSDLMDSESGLIFNPAKITPTRPQDPIYLKRSGFLFKKVGQVVKDATECANECADKVWHGLDNELLNGKQHSKSSFEVIAKDYGLTQNECRAGFSTLAAQGRVELIPRPLKTKNGKGGAHNYYQPLILNKPFASLNHNNESIENDEL